MTIVGLFGLIASSCINDEISTSSSDILTFSRDTVDFDTVFTDLGTPTARLIVFNRAKKGVNISSIRLRDPDSRFSFNVDGMSGHEFSDVEIRAKDSIYIFIECKVPPTETAEPFLVEDELLFVTNGVTQGVRLEAYGQNVTRLRGERIMTDTRLTAERPYIIFDSLSVERGATLTVDPGARLLFHDGARLSVRGVLDAVGEAGRMIEMRGDRLDNVLPGVGYDIMAGQWDGVRIEASSFGNRMEYVDMRSTKIGLVVDSCGDLSRSKLLLRNSWLHNSQGNVLSSVHANVDAYGCCFSEAADAVVSLTGGKHNFIQCTIANNYLFSAIRGALLTLRHTGAEKEEEKDNSGNNPFMSASFDNCIIYGLAADISPLDLKGADVFLRYVMLRSEGKDDDNFINCFWDEDPMFMTVRADYYFNYRLQQDSPALGVGNPAYVNQLTLYDMDGNDRLADGPPALGAYAK